MACESGEARLAALAARDLAIAYDIAQLETDERATFSSADLAGPALPEIESEVAFVLDIDPALGVPPWPSQWDGRAQLSATGEHPRRELRAGAVKAVEQVRDDATEVVVAGLKGVVGGALGDALAALGTGLVAQLPSTAKRWYRWALRLVKEAIEKLRRIFGGLFDKAVGKITTWIEEHAEQTIADKVYEIPRLRTALEGLIDRAADDKDWSKVGEDIQRVVEKHATQKKVILAVFKALSFARKWILHVIAGPTGEAVVGGVFLLGAGYGLFSGGDYEDWYRTDDDGAFNFVRGIRTTAEDQLADG